MSEELSLDYSSAEDISHDDHVSQEDIISLQDISHDDHVSQEDITWSLRMPQNVLLEISRYLTSDKDLVHFAKVCKTWREIAYSTELWRDRKVKVNALADAVSYIDSLKERGVKKISFYFPTDRMAITYCDPRVVQDTVVRLYGVTHEMGDVLEELDVNGLFLQDEDISAVFDEPMVNMKSLVLNSYGVCTDTSIHTVLKQCKQLAHLSHNLPLSPGIISIYGQLHASKLTARLDYSPRSLMMPDIVHLDLSGSKIYDDEIPNIARLQNLKCLILRYCFYLTPSCIDILSNEKSPIKELDLRWCAHVTLGDLLRSIGDCELYLERLFVTSSIDDVENEDSFLQDLVCSGRACNLKELVIDGVFSELSGETMEMLRKECKDLEVIQWRWGSSLSTAALPTYTELPRVPDNLQALEYLQHIMQPLYHPILPAHFNSMMDYVAGLLESNSAEDILISKECQLLLKAAEDSKRLLKELLEPSPQLCQVFLSPRHN